MPSKLTVRCTPEQYKTIEDKAKELGFKNTSEYIRVIALNAEVKVSIKEGEGERGRGRMSKKFVLIDEQEIPMKLHVALYENDNEDQILCTLAEKSVLELVIKDNGLLPTDLDIDGDVTEYILQKYGRDYIENERMSVGTNKY